MSRGVKSKMLGAHRRAVQEQHATALQDAVDDRGGEVVVVEYSAPVVRVLVRREDHRALRLMSVVDDVVEHVGGVLAVREVADLVANEHVRRDVAHERVGELTIARSDREILDELGGGDEERVEAVLDRAVADGDREVRLPASRLTVEDQVAPVGDEVG
jgi:hypothetical protein